jgi:serine protease Do
MRLDRFAVLKLAGLTVTLMGVAALAFVVAPAVYGQDRPRVLNNLLTLSGGNEIGVSLRDVEEADVKRDKLPGLNGAIVENVERTGPAARAGFRAGDVVISFDGENVRSARHLARLLSETPDGREVSATVLRGGERVALKVAPEARNFGAFNFQSFNKVLTPETHKFVVPEIQGFDADRFVRPVPGYMFRNDGGLFSYVFGRSRLGVNVQDLTDQLGEYFGTATGALVTEVEDGTPAKTAGLKAGDVITKINDQTVRTTADVRRVMNTTSGEVVITVMRDRKELTLKTKIEDEALVERRIRRKF